MCWFQGTQACQLIKPVDVPVRLQARKTFAGIVCENNVEQALRQK
jgi:hypothetical protein